MYCSVYAFTAQTTPLLHAVLSWKPRISPGRTISLTEESGPSLSLSLYTVLPGTVTAVRRVTSLWPIAAAGRTTVHVCTCTVGSVRASGEPRTTPVNADNAGHGGKSADGRPAIGTRYTGMSSRRLMAAAISPRLASSVQVCMYPCVVLRTGIFSLRVHTLKCILSTVQLFYSLRLRPMFRSARI